MTRTSKKQMNEAEATLRSVYPNDTVWAAGEYDATGKAYIRHDGTITEYANNSEAYEAIAEMVFEAEGF